MHGRPSRGLGGRHCMHVCCTQRLSTDGPVTLFEFLDPDPGHRAHSFAFDSDHGFRDIGNQVLLLARAEHVLDDVNRYEWHCIVSFVVPLADHSAPAETGNT